ncbi:hypothetical protein B6I21_08295 [candidate division KSB1 bacterium 4572_119]|nr:MAG: hypothetical protein B6I21_08295 [candidate division KSB1 bacterium 4572_119]
MFKEQFSLYEYPVVLYHSVGFVVLAFGMIVLSITFFKILFYQKSYCDCLYFSGDCATIVNILHRKKTIIKMLQSAVTPQLWEYSRCRTLEIVIVDTIQEINKYNC